jgi:hypothetical protein
LSKDKFKPKVLMEFSLGWLRLKLSHKHWQSKKKRLNKGTKRIWNKPRKSTIKLFKRKRSKKPKRKKLRKIKPKKSLKRLKFKLELLKSLNLF